MANNTYDCDATSNKLSDLEIQELYMQLIGAILEKLLPGQELKALVSAAMSLPDASIKLMDALEKSSANNYAYSDFAEVAGALVNLVDKAAESIGSGVKLYAKGNGFVKILLLLNDLTEANSPIRKLWDQIQNGHAEPMVYNGDDLSNIINGGKLGDTLNGMGGDDIINGGSGKDFLYGGSGNDVLNGGACDDYLEGGSGSDKLIGGSGYDTYLSNNGDMISDSDGKGRVVFESMLLSGGMATKGECKPNGDGTYKGNGGTYTLTGGILTFVQDNTGKSVKIFNFKNGNMGITLTPDNSQGGGSCPPPPPKPSPGTPNPNFSSPLVLDLNGDGVTSTFIYDSSTYFDHNNDGTRERTGWIQADDGILVFDKNQDGMINNGNELFGNNSTLKNGTKAANGFEALREYDENKDGMIDSKDNVYNTLRVWQDGNGDGISQTSELKTLSDLGVKSIGTVYANIEAYDAQNVARQRSFFTTETLDTDGNTVASGGNIDDVWFMTNTQDTARDTTIILKDTVAVIPDYRGAGRVENLSTAMNSNAKLESAVTVLLTKSSTATYASLLGDVKNILALWTKTDNISATTTRGVQYKLNHNYAYGGTSQPIATHQIYAYARDVAILETFWGQNFTMNVEGQTTSNVIGTEMSAYMTNAINTLTDTVLATLLVQQLYGKEAYDVTQGQFDYTGLFGKLTDTLSAGTTNEKSTASNLLATLIHRDGLETLSYLDSALLNDTSFQTLLSNNGVTYKINLDGTISGSYTGTIEGGNGNDTIQSTIDGTVYGGAGDDIILGTDGIRIYTPTGNEILHGGAGNDTVIGGAGSDILYGDEGDDTLYANSKDSLDGIYGHDILIGGRGNDTLVGTGRATTYVYNYGDGFDTIIDGGNTGLTPDTLELRGIRLEDITVGRVGDDMIFLIKDIADSEQHSGSITIKGGFAISHSNYNYENNNIESFIFDDQTLSFAKMLLVANESFQADNIYTFDRGNGIKTILDYGSKDGDTLQFGEEIRTNDVEFKVSSTSNDLILALKEDGKTFSQLSDKLTITNWFNADNRIESFTFSNGITLDVNAIVDAQGTEDADTVHLVDSSTDVILNLRGGNDTVTTSGGNDTLIGGTGNDALNGGMGDDTYVFAKGDGIDTIIDTAGADTLKFVGGITADDLIVKASANGNDLIVALKEEGKTFDQLTDKITLKSWFDPSSRIEMFIFNNGTVLSVNDIISTQATEGDDIVRPADMTLPINMHLLGGDDGITTGSANDTIYGNSGNDTIQTQNGNDTLIGGEGNDSLQGGSGNDTYVFDKGDGQDTITDEDRYTPYYWAPYYTLARNAGNDTLQFAEGITADDLIVKASANSSDLIVALKEDGKTFAQLTDKITLKNWFNADNRIENLTFNDGTTWSVTDIVNAQGTEDADTVHLVDSTTDAILSLRGGNDTVITSDGNDTLIGGTDNDTLNGGAGNDTYVFAKGDGIDTIIDRAGSDTLKFTNGITADDLIVKAYASSNDLIVALKEDGKTFAELTDKITIKNWFNADNRIESFTFSNGITLDVNAIVDAQGTEDADTVHLVDSTSDVTLNLKGGNDTVTTSDGNDTLIGGAGNDTLNGGMGDDTYVFAKGDGIDTIIDTAGADTLKFVGGITADDLIVKASANSNDLIVALKEDGKTFAELTDKITLKNWFNADNRIENIEFADGTVWDVNNIVNAQGTEDADTVHLVDSTSDVTLNLKGGNDTVTTLGGNDTLNGGTGNDTLSGAAGDDTYVFAKGDGIDNIIDASGIDALSFGIGIAVDHIVVMADKTNDDLIVALKEDGKTFEQLTDKIILKNWYLDENRIESFTFDGGIVLDTLAITQLQTADAGDNYLRYLDHDNTIDANEGTDVIEGSGGNDT